MIIKTHSRTLYWYIFQHYPFLASLGKLSRKQIDNKFSQKNRVWYFIQISLGDDIQGILNTTFWKQEATASEIAHLRTFALSARLDIHI